MNAITEYSREYLEQFRADVNYQRFTPTDKSDFDYRVSERILIGRLTKVRWQIIYRYCRFHSFRPKYRCGHDYDCCGCFCGQHLSIEHSHNMTVITLSQSFNY